MTKAPQNSPDLPLRRIALLASRVGYFEHSGNINSVSAVEISLLFDTGAVNNALKSLVINYPSSSSPSVRYTAQNTVERTLKSLRIDLSA
jgi:predicted aspartyl protease